MWGWSMRGFKRGGGVLQAAAGLRVLVGIMGEMDAGLVESILCSGGICGAVNRRLCLLSFSWSQLRSYFEEKNRDSGKW